MYKLALMSRRGGQRLLAGFAASLLAHAVVLLWVFHQDERRPVTVTAPEPIRWVWLEPPPESQAPGKLEISKPSQGGSSKRRSAKPGKPSAPKAEVHAEQDVPRQAPGNTLSIVPRLELSPAQPDEPPHGWTVRNEPGALPGPDERMAEEAARVASRVEGFARDDLARARVESGLVDPYFGDFRRRFSNELANPSLYENPSAPELAQQLARSWMQGAQNYGRTGSPFEASPSPLLPPEVPSAVAREADRGSTQAKSFADTLSAGARLRDFGEGRMGAELYAVLEIRQSPDGAVKELRLVEASGVPAFDQWVRVQAQAAVEALGAPQGDHPNGLHSMWGVRGKVTYKRDLRETNLVDDGWYLALALVPALLTGTFDELSDKVEYIDLRHPRLECRVKLLRVY